MILKPGCFVSKTDPLKRDHFNLIFGPIIYFRYQFYKRSQFFNKNEIIDYQNMRLKKIIRHAARQVPYYKKLFSDINLAINSFSGINDLRGIPFLDKETIRLQGEDFISVSVKKSAIKWEKTSGSTGTPLQLVLDDNTRINKYSATYRAYHWASYNLGNWIFIIDDASPGQDNIYHIDKFTRSIGFYSNQVSRENSLLMNELLWKFKPKIFLGFGLSFLMMGKFIQESGKKNYSPAALINYGECISSQVKNQIESLFSTKFYDYYSHTENVVLIHQCAKGKLHVAEDFAYHEVIDERGHAVDEGKGELVGTGFYNYAMPLIRYKTRDFVEVQKKPCACGRSSRVISNIIGRRDDYIITPEGKYLFLPEGGISYSKHIILSQYIQEKIDQLTINLVIDKDFQYSELSMIESGLRKIFGNSMKFGFNIVDELEKTKSGKTKFIISRIGNKFA